MKIGPIVNNHPISVSIVMLHLYMLHSRVIFASFCRDLLLSVITFTNVHNFFGIYLPFVKNEMETSQ